MTGGTAIRVAMMLAAVAIGRGWRKPRQTCSAPQAAIENLKSRIELQHVEIAQAESVIAATQAHVERTKLEAARSG